MEDVLGLDVHPTMVKAELTLWLLPCLGIVNCNCLQFYYLKETDQMNWGQVCNPDE